MEHSEKLEQPLLSISQSIHLLHDKRSIREEKDAEVALS